MHISFVGWGVCFDRLTPYSVSDAPGSGIALYAALVWAIDFSVSIDGGTLTQHHFDGVWNCCDAGIQPMYNFKIYDIETLSPGNHGLDLSQLSASVGYAINNSSHSALFFDYAVVNNGSNGNPNSSAGPSKSKSR